MGCGAILIGHTNYQVPFAEQILPLPSSFILDISAKDNASPHPNGGGSGRQKRARLYPVIIAISGEATLLLLSGEN